MASLSLVRLRVTRCFEVGSHPEVRCHWLLTRRWRARHWRASHWRSRDLSTSIAAQHGVQKGPGDPNEHAAGRATSWCQRDIATHCAVRHTRETGPLRRRWGSLGPVRSWITIETAACCSSWKLRGLVQSEARTGAPQRRKKSAPRRRRFPPGILKRKSARRAPWAFFSSFLLHPSNSIQCESPKSGVGQPVSRDY